MSPLHPFPRNQTPWPFEARRFPRLDDPDYLGSKGLSAALQKVVKEELAGSRRLNVLDVGCGHKPFFPFLEPFAGAYIGTDIIPGSSLLDIVCPAEHLAVADGWADLVLCLSVLEHVDDPAQVIRELGRVLKPGGTLFLSTHGCFPWHPYPQDHWRWTQTGLPLLIKTHGSFCDIRIVATRGTVSGMAFLLAHYTQAWCAKSRIRSKFRRMLVAAVNWTGEHLDRHFPSLKDLDRPVTAIPEFFVLARKTGSKLPK